MLTVRETPWNARTGWFIRTEDGDEHLTTNSWHASIAQRALETGRLVWIGSSAGFGFLNLYSIRFTDEPRTA